MKSFDRAAGGDVFAEAGKVVFLPKPWLPPDGGKPPAGLRLPVPRPDIMAFA